MAAITTVRTSTQDDSQRRLKAELQALRRKGALRPGPGWGTEETGSGGRACARCRAELGRIMNRGAFCRACRLRVCKACREYSVRSTDWVCSVCHKHMEIQAATGEWMNEYVRRPSRRRDNRVYVPAADIIKRSIRRSWTISNPSPRWSALRGSPEWRAYSSLPRHQDCSYPVANNPYYSSVLCPDPGSNENLPPLTNSLISPPPSKQPPLQSCTLSSERDRPGTPPLQSHVLEPQLLPSFRDRVHTSPLPIMARQRRYSPSRGCVDRDTPDEERFMTDRRFHPGERGRGFLNRNTKSESDHDCRSPVTSTPIMDCGIHDGYSSSPTSRRRELLKHPRIGDGSYHRSSDVVVCSRQYGDIRQTFNDDSSPTPVRNIVHDQHDEKRKSMMEQDTAKASMISEEQRRESAVGLDSTKGTTFDDEPKQEQRGDSVMGLESVKSNSDNQKSLSSLASAVCQGDSAPVKAQRRHPLIKNSPVLSPISRSMSSFGQADVYHSGSVALEYSGNSDSGGEVMATPPMPSRRFGSMFSAGKRSDDGPLEESPGPGGSSPASVRASSGDDIMDAEPLFRKVTIKKRRQETRRLVEGNDDASISEDIPSVVLPPHSKSASPSPIVGAGSRKGPGSVSSGEWPPSPEEDIDRLVAIHQQRSSLSSLGPRSDSLASVYSGAGEGQYGTVAVKGEVEFGLEYNYKAGALEIHVKQCRDLAPVDTKRNRSDPYVKVYLLPDKSKSGKRKTKVKKHTLNPVFDETLKFQITLHGLETRTLWLTVWHSDMFGRNDFLGEVMMALENKVFDDPSPHWYPLQERTEPFDDLLSYKGDLIIGLKFVPPDVTSAIQKKGKRSSRGSLNVLVKEAKNLTAVKANGTSDPFCKSYLLPDKGRSSKQKTPVLRRTCSPVWNYTFVYEDVSLQELSERSLELTVWDHDRLASNEFLGGLRFNLGTGKHYGKAVDWMDATGKEVTLWQHMLERPNFWVEGCLTLRPSLEHRNSS